MAASGQLASTSGVPNARTAVGLPTNVATGRGGIRGPVEAHNRKHTGKLVTFLGHHERGVPVALEVPSRQHEEVGLEKRIWLKSSGDERPPPSFVFGGHISDLDKPGVHHRGS